MSAEAARLYAAKHSPHALLLMQRGIVAIEEYAGGYGASRPHALYSGSKSFWGIAALQAAQEGLFALDEPVVATLPEFGADERAQITPRMLLTMTAGYGFGGLGTAVPTLARVLEIPLKHAPGKAFTYGGIPLQVFGAFFTRRLASSGITPHEYLRKRVLEPAGAQIAFWRVLGDGSHPLPTGAHVTARHWVAFGRFVIERWARYRAAFAGTAANPRYGLGWWLGGPGMPSDTIYASGSNGQGLYLAPSAGIACVRFGGSTGYKHDAFLKRLFSSAV
jgi:CubicO group peptidase (beta-lactamase class C family)